MEKNILEIDEYILIIFERMMKIANSIFEMSKTKREVSTKKIYLFFRLFDIFLYIKDGSFFLKNEFLDFLKVIAGMEPFYFKTSDEEIFKDIINFYKEKNFEENNKLTLTLENVKEEAIFMIYYLQNYVFINENFQKKINLLRENSLRKKEKLSNKERFSSIDNKVKDEKKNFSKNIFDLDDRLSHFEGYEKILKQSAIKEFLLEIINIKETADRNNYYLYLVNRVRRGEKILHRSLYRDIKEKVEGLDTSILCNQISSILLEEKFPLETIYKENKNFNNNNLAIIEALKKATKEGQIQIEDWSEIQKINFKEKKVFSEGINLIFSKKEQDNTSNICDYAKELEMKENLKYKGLFFLEIFSIVSYEKLKYLLFMLKDQKKYILENFLENKKKLEENKKNISLRNYMEIYITEQNIPDLINKLVEKLKEENKIQAKPTTNLVVLNKLKKINKDKKIPSTLKIKLENISEEILPDFLEILIKFYFIKQDSKFTIKDELTRHTINYLRLNDYISELKMYLKILEEIKIKSHKELREELEKQKINKQKINFMEEKIQERRAKDLIWVESSSYIQRNKKYLKSIKMSPSFNLKQEEEQYRKEYKHYKSTIYIKYIYMKLYFDNSITVASRNYFDEFCSIIRIYIELLERALITLNPFDKIFTDMYLNQLINQLIYGF